MAKQNQPKEDQAVSSQKANSKRKHEEIVDGTDVTKADDTVAQSEERAPKQVKTQ